MNIFKKIVALVLICMMVLSFAGCHKKDEIAVTVSGEEFTSAYYMNALISAESEAQSKLQETLSEEELSAEDFDYHKQKIDGVDYAKWIENRAIESIKEVAAYRLLCKENELSLDEQKTADAEQMATYYWNSYGYGNLLQPNGVGFETYKQSLIDRYYADLYFDYLYAEGGKEEITTDEMNKVYGEAFILADALQFDYTDEEGARMSDTQVLDLKDSVNAYAEKIKSGKMTFEEVYNEVNKSTEPGIQETENEDEPKPVYPHASVLGDKDTIYENEHFESVKKMGVGEVQVIENSTNDAIFIYVKRDIFADAYYIDMLDNSVRHFIKDKDFEKLVEDYTKKLETKISNYAVKQFKVKNIKYPEYAY